MIDRLTAMSWLEGLSQDDWRECHSDSEVQEIARQTLALLREQEPKSPIHIHEEYSEHDWETDEDGNIDEWVMDFEFHHGPACKRCGYSFCVNCKPNGWNEEPCVVDYYQCPKCGIRIFKDGGKTMYCERCGQEVNWE